MTDPIASLADIRVALLCHSPGSRAYQVALAELERRARIEARRDAWLADPRAKSFRDCRQSFPRFESRGHVRVTLHEGGSVIFAHGPNYWTALEAALNAAGAP